MSEGKDTLRLNVELEMIQASAQLHLDEMLEGKSEEYKRGFQDGRTFELEVTNAIFNA